MAQNLDKRIEEFGKAVQFDAKDKYSFYREFIFKARVKFALKLEEAEDIWQEMMLKLISINTKGHHPIETYRYDIDGEKGFNDPRLSEWLMISLFNGCRDYLREKKSRKNMRGVQIPINENEEDLLLVGSEEEPLDKMIREEDKESIERCLNKIDPKYRGVLEAINYDGLKYSEAAGKLGIPEGTFKSRYHTARKIFREIHESTGAV